MPPRAFRCPLAALLLLGVSVGEALAQDASGSSSSSSSLPATCGADVALDALSSDDVCGSYCASYEPCAVLNSAGLTCESDGSVLGDTSDCVVNDACAVACAQYSSLSFTVYVPFGSYQSEEEIAERAVDNDSYQIYIDTLYGSADGYFYLNDDLLDTVGTVELNPYTSSVVIAGGQSEMSFYKSKVANVSLTGTFVANQSQVTSVTLTSLNLKDQVVDLPALLPSTVTSLTLENDLLYEFPWAVVEVMPSLSTLSVRKNYFSSVTAPTASTYTSLIYLSLSDNAITEFDGSFPNVETLLLDGNNLTQIPAAISQMPFLTYLDMGENSIKTVDSSVSSDSVTSLYLNQNGLTKFEGSFPNLETLFLSSNSLTAIPESIYECSKLSYLTISYNPLTLNLTRAQLEFLRKIETIDISAADVANATWDCSMDQLHGVAVCITDADETATTSSDADDGGGSNTSAIIGGVVGGVVALALLIAAIAFFMYRKRNSNDADGKDYQSVATPAAGSTVTDSNDVTTTGMSTVSSSTLLASDPKLLPLQLNPSDLQDIRMIGEGSTGVYWLVRYRRDKLLASKRLRTEDARRDNVAAFVREIKLMATLDHPTIVKFAGISWRAGEKEEPVQVAASLQALFEYVDNGTLQEYLANPGVPRTWHAEKLDIAIDVADALVYLHSLSPPVLHRDVRSSNVLLTNDMRGKLASFGCAKLGDSGDGIGDLASFHGSSFGGSGRGEAVDERGASAARWVAPEVLASASDHGEAADMYSFGVMLLELDSHGLPFDDAFTRNTGSDTRSRVVDERAVLQRIVAGELQPAFGLKCPPALVTLGLACLDRNPWNRPRAPNVAYKLRQVLKAFGATA